MAAKQIKTYGGDTYSIVKDLLSPLDPVPEREGLKDTPRRVAGAWTDLVATQYKPPLSVVGNAVFDLEYDWGGEPGWVAVGGVNFATISAETLLPLCGKCRVAYKISGNKVLGLSKVARLAKAISKRIQTQQQFTELMAETIIEATKCKNVAVVSTALHVYYDKPPKTHTIRHLAGEFENNSHNEELDALLPIEDVEKPNSPNEKARQHVLSDADRNILVRMETSIKQLFTALDLPLPNQDAFAGYSRQLFYATIGQRTDSADVVCASPRLVHKSVLTRDLRLEHGTFACVVPFQSMCEHHLLPFHGWIFVGFKTRADRQKRMVDRLGSYIATVTRRLQVQERLTNQIADFLKDQLEADSVVVLADAAHLCMVARGPEMHHASTRTVCSRGKTARNLLLLGNRCLSEKL